MIGSRFVASYRRNEAGEIIPRVTGRAYVCGDTELIFHPEDPFADVASREHGMSRNGTVIVVGGGIVGIGCAHYLQQGWLRCHRHRPRRHRPSLFLTGTVA